MNKIAQLSTQESTLADELQKNPELNVDHIQQLVDLMSDLGVSELCREVELACLYHSCNFDLEDSKECLRAFLYYMASTPEISTNRNICSPGLWDFSKIICTNVLPVRDPFGCQIILQKMHPDHTSAEEYDFKFAFKMIVMAIRACSAIEGVVPGYTVVLDSAGASFRHLLALDIAFFGKILRFVQEAVPIKLNAIHIVNSHPVMWCAMAVAKPFIRNASLYQKIHFHAKNSSSLEQYLPTYCLPKDYGGDLESVEHYHSQFIQWMTSLKEFFEAEDQALGKLIEEIESNRSDFLDKLNYKY